MNNNMPLALSEQKGTKRLFLILLASVGAGLIAGKMTCTIPITRPAIMGLALEGILILPFLGESVFKAFRKKSKQSPITISRFSGSTFVFGLVLFFVFLTIAFTRPEGCVN